MYAESEGPDQIAHLRSLIKAFAVRIQNHYKRTAEYIDVKAKTLSDNTTVLADVDRYCLIEGPFSHGESQYLLRRLTGKPAKCHTQTAQFQRNLRIRED